MNCLTCGKAAGQRCGRCHVAMYCGGDCQQRDWARHKEECGREHSMREALGPQYSGCAFAVARLNEVLGGMGRELVVGAMTIGGEESGKADKADKGGDRPVTARIRKRRASLPLGAFRRTDGQVVLVRGNPTPAIAEVAAWVGPALRMEPKVQLLVLCPGWPMSKAIQCGGFLVPLIYNGEITQSATAERGIVWGEACRLPICWACTSCTCDGKCELARTAGEEMKTFRRECPRSEDLRTLLGGRGLSSTTAIHLLEYARMIRQALGHEEAQIAWYTVGRFLRAHVVALDGREVDNHVYLMYGATEVLEIGTDYHPRRRPMLQAVQHLVELREQGMVDRPLALLYCPDTGLLMPDIDFADVRRSVAAPAAPPPAQ